MNKQSITFSASEQTLEKLTGDDQFASNTVSYVEATFTLGTNWAGFDSVRAVWKSQHYEISMVLDQYGKCDVPAEVMYYKSKVFVNLVGVSTSGDEITDRLTTYPTLAFTIDSDSAVEGTETTDITPSQFDQFVSQVSDDAAAAAASAADAEAAAASLTVDSALSTSSTNPVQNKVITGAVNDLKEDITELDNAVFSVGQKRTPDAIIDGWGITSEGVSINQPPGQKILRYNVEGERSIYVKSEAYFQFQNNTSIPSWNNTYIIGTTMNDYDGLIDVPDGALYLMISISPEDETSSAYLMESNIEHNTELINELKSDVYNNETVDVNYTNNLTNTVYVTNGGVGTTVDTTGITDNQFRAIILPCESDDVFKITGTGGNAQRLWCFTDSDYKILSVSNAYAAATNSQITAANDGYLIYQISTAYAYKIEKIGANIQTVKAEDYLKYLELFTSVSMFQSIAGVGDSYTEGDLVTSGGTWLTKTGINYIAILGKRNGVETKNYGSGGRSTKTYLESIAFSEALTDPASDLYIYALGQNDVNQGTTKGTIADIHDADYTQNPDTFYGNYGRIIARIKAHSPNAKFVMIGSWVDGTSPGSGIAYQSYNEDIEAIANHYGVPYIDPFEDEFFNSNFYKNYKSSGHPTAMLYAGMALAFERLFAKCVVDNANYFKYALIG